MATSKGDREVKPMKGLGAWIGSPSENEKSSPTELRSVTEVSIKSIQFSKSQPRKYFDSDKLDQLAQSIKEHGILEPLLVRPAGKNKYELIAGERRLRAAKLAKLTNVPISIQDVDDLTASQISLIENLQREDLNPVEETEGILQLLALTLEIPEQEVCALFHQSYNAQQRDMELNHNVMIQLKTIDNLLAQVGRFNANSFRSNRLPLLNLPDEILTELRAGKVKYTKAQAIARVKDPEKRIELLNNAINNNLSLAEIRSVIDEIKSESQQKKTQREIKFSHLCQNVSKKLISSKVWNDTQKRKEAEKLLKQLEQLIDS